MSQTTKNKRKRSVAVLARTHKVFINDSSLVLI
jgi:hypothetical protein